MKKSIFSILLAISLIFCMTTNTFAESTPTKEGQNIGNEVIFVEDMTHDEYLADMAVRNANIASTASRHTHLYREQWVGFSQLCYDDSGNKHVIQYLNKICQVCSYSYETGDISIVSCHAYPKCTV